jgi:hypothetical protein
MTTLLCNFLCCFRVNVCVHQDCFLRVWAIDTNSGEHSSLQAIQTPSQPVSVAGKPDKCVGGCANGSMYFYDIVGM